MYTSAAGHKHDWRASERRSCHREPLQWAVLVFFGDNWGKLIDLSERGMSFQFAHAPSPDDPIQFTFEAMGCMPIPQDGKIFNEAIQATGQIVWTLEFERTAGVKFLELSSRSRDQIRYWMSSVPAQDAVPSKKMQDNERNSAGSRKPASAAPALASFEPAETAAVEGTAAFEPHTAFSEKDVEARDSKSKVQWQSSPTFSNSSESHAPIEPDAEVTRKPKSAFASLGQKPMTPDSHWQEVSEPEAAFVPEESDSAASDSPVSETQFQEQSEFETVEPEVTPRRAPLASEIEELWQSKSVAASQKLEALGLEASGFLKHDERHKRGQTLELKQRRARIGYAAVLSFVVTLAALAGIIGFISKFNERAEGTPGVARQSETQAASNRTDGSAGVESTGPFLVEVLDANNRRSLLWFTSDASENISARTAEKPTLVPASTTPVEARREEKAGTAVEARRETSHDFSLAPPHAIVPENASAENPSAPVAPTLPAESLPDTPLSGVLPSPARPAPPEGAVRLGGEVQPARLIHATLPVYPELARTSRTAGDVTLDALVDAQGNVRDVKVISGPVLLQEAAKAALRQWKYEPARLDGQPTTMHLTVTVKFRNEQNSK